MNEIEPQALKEKLLDLRRRLESEGSHLLEQATRVERLYGQETARSRGYRTEYRMIKVSNQPKVDQITKALQELENGNPQKAVSILATERR